MTASSSFSPLTTPSFILLGERDEAADWWARLEGWHEEGLVPPVLFPDPGEGKGFVPGDHDDGLLLCVFRDTGPGQPMSIELADEADLPVLLLGRRAQENDMAALVGGSVLDYLVMDDLSPTRFRTTLELAWQRRQTKQRGLHWRKRLKHYWETFARITAHDLREPLRALHNYTTFLEEDLGSWISKENRDYLSSIRRLSSRMDRMLADLHRLTRLASAPLACRELDLMPLVIGVMQELAPQIKSSGTEIRVVMPLPQVCADEEKLAEVIHRLVSNAIDHNPNPDPYVEVGARQEGAHCVIFVRDNGDGVADEISDQIFELFRGYKKKSRVADGSGAGLTIADQLVRLHRGRIWFESNPGEGTTFYVALPLQQASDGTPWK
ncbi:sensor histidine kinase [Acanthopleuribacter pedis]|uniref:histidine kinase n=1 Tax=Acanthopleuribacter pedis TaxID=442870 RepID=A0A8J7QGC3_9BACT|nr:ATP-binding protein [Acanthopleuribacter pedis]MBO1321765.1 hypothetical protein [Acanthopleuribacter pedis]